MSRSASHWFAACAALSVLLAAGCGGDRSTPPGSPTGGQTLTAPARPDQPGTDRSAPDFSVAQCAAESLFAALQSAYVRKDLDAYAGLFSADFAFVFYPPDWQNPNDPTPVQWGLAEELTAHDHLFHSELVDRIALTFQVGRAVPSWVDYPGTWKVDMTRVNLRVFTRRQDGTPWVYGVPNGNAVFYLKPVDTGGQGRAWRIWRWEDQALDGLGGTRFVEMMSWGRLKNLYH